MREENPIRSSFSDLFMDLLPDRDDMFIDLFYPEGSDGREEALARLAQKRQDRKDMTEEEFQKKYPPPSPVKTEYCETCGQEIYDEEY